MKISYDKPIILPLKLINDICTYAYSQDSMKTFFFRRGKGFCDNPLRENYCG